MATIRFIKDYVAKTHSPDPTDPKNERYHVKDEREVSDATANHFIKRGVAELVSSGGRSGKGKAAATEEGDADKAAAQNGDSAGKPAAGSAGSGGKGGKSL